MNSAHRPESRRAPSPLVLAGVVVLIFIAGAAAMFGLAGQRAGMQFLPTADATLDVMPDEVAQLTWEKVRQLPGTAWRRWPTSAYIQSSFGGAVWVRVTLHNPTRDVQSGVLADAEYFTDRIDLWTLDEAAPDGWSHRHSGESVSGAAKPIWGRDAAFFVTVPARGTRVVFLRAQDYFGVWLRVVWWPEAKDFFSAQLRDALAEALYFGALAALFLYNAVIWSRLRHRDLGLYLAYLGSVAIFMFFSRAEALQLGFALGSPRLEPIAIAAMAGSSGFLARFAREFLRLQAIAPRLDWVARTLVLLNLVLALGAVSLAWSNNTQWMHYAGFATIATHAAMICSAVVAWRAGVQQARFFLLSFGALLLGVVPYGILWLWVIPLGITPYLLMLGSALEMLLLSVALSDRFARLERDRQAAVLAEEKAQLELLRYQLNPHFLFNALNSVYGFVLPHSRPAAELVRHLAEFCRHTLTRRQDDWHPLGHEAAMLRTYFDIEQLRWGERLVVRFDVAEDAALFPLPPLLLLPLVENAIKHGGATSPDQLTVQLEAQLDADGALVLAVSNSGRWLEAGAPRATPSTGIGLENLRARLARYFPASHSLEILPRDGWITVRLRIAPSDAGIATTPRQR